MMTILIILGVVAGGLAGYKYGVTKGLDRSYVVQDEDAVKSVLRVFAKAKKERPNAPGEWLVRMDRAGFDVFNMDDHE